MDETIENKNQLGIIPCNVTPMSGYYQTQPQYEQETGSLNFGVL